MTKSQEKLNDQSTIDNKSKLQAHNLLEEAIQNNAILLVRELLKQSDVREEFLSIHHHIHLATHLGHYAIVKILLEESGNSLIDVRDRKNNTPLHIACKKDDYIMIQLLLDKEANPNLLNLDGHTAKCIALKKKNRDIIKCIDRELISEKDFSMLELDTYLENFIDEVIEESYALKQEAELMEMGLNDFGDVESDEHKLEYNSRLRQEEKSYCGKTLDGKYKDDMYQQSASEHRKANTTFYERGCSINHKRPRSDSLRLVSSEPHSSKLAKVEVEHSVSS